MLLIILGMLTGHMLVIGNYVLAGVLFLMSLVVIFDSEETNDDEDV